MADDDSFEYDGTFYRWHVSDMGKDLMLIDRFSGLPLAEFFDAAEDGFDRSRGPMLLTLIATSIRFGHPDWTVERIVRTVMDLNLSEVRFIEADEDAALPPANGERTRSTGNGSVSPLRSTSSEPEPETSETSSVTPD